MILDSEVLLVSSVTLWMPGSINFDVSRPQRICETRIYCRGRKDISVETGHMSSVETGHMSAAEPEQISAAEPGQLSVCS